MTNPWAPRRETPLTPLGLVRALREGHIVAFSSDPSDDRLACGFAHIGQEAGQGSLLTNWNFGHIRRGKTWTGPLYLWGEDVDEQQLDGTWAEEDAVFRSYDAAHEGAADYWRMMAGAKYAPALAIFDEGEPYLAAFKLREIGWFASSAATYAKGMESLFAKARAKLIPELRALVTGDPTTASRWLALGDAVRRGQFGLPPDDD